MVSIAVNKPFISSSIPHVSNRSYTLDSDEFIGGDSTRKRPAPPSPSFSRESFDFWKARPATTTSERPATCSHPLRHNSEISFGISQPQHIGQASDDKAEATSAISRQVYTEAASDIDLRIGAFSDTLVVSNFPPRREHFKITRSNCIQLSNRIE